MKRFLNVVFLLSLLLAATPLRAQMSDNDIISYISAGVAAGKSQSQIGNELLAKGVTMSQARRLLQTYRSLAPSVQGSVQITDSDSNHGTRRSGVDESREELIERAIDDNVAEPESHNQIFGQRLFSSRSLSFEPNQNIATPANYVLGPGDELVIDIWGDSEATIRQTVTAEGRIYLSQVGPVAVSGLTIAKAESKLKKALSHKYSLGGSNPASELCLTLGNVRSIQVNVLGEVNVPGTYRLSSLSTAFHALYRAGGISSIGSLRNIQVLREGKVVSTLDVYRYLFAGDDSVDIPLREGDVVIVPPYTSLVSIKGGVKRAMKYEVLENESVETLVSYAGGFVSNAYANELAVERMDGSEGRVYSVPASEFASFKVCDGDVVTAYINTRSELFTNRVEVKGSVLRPGVYALGSEIATVRQLVEHAGGLLEDAFPARAQIVRENKDRSLSVVAVAIGAIASGQAQDVMLQKNDVLIVFNANEIEVKGDVSISGYVNNPGSFGYADGMTVEDLILLAGGLSEGMGGAMVEVSRRIADFDAMEPGDTLASVFSFKVSDAYELEGATDFVLAPYDIVSVRKSPAYKRQAIVRISGEAVFPGEYTLVSNSERLSDLMSRACGVTPNAYVQGAMLRRTITEDERNVRRNMATAVNANGMAADSIERKKYLVGEQYSVGIRLDEALSNPGSDKDLVLRDGDELIIPAYTNTVRIQGEVMYPNAVTYVPGKSIRYYVGQAGGFNFSAKRKKVFVVYMNGEVAVGMNAKVRPGCEIVVPGRYNEQRLSVGEWLGIGTSAASITTMIATIINLLK